MHQKVIKNRAWVWEGVQEELGDEREGRECTDTVLIYVALKKN